MSSPTRTRRCTARASSSRCSPTGIFYSGGVQANVLFFDKKPASIDGTPWTSTLWVYDLRTAQHFTLEQNPLRRDHLQDFVYCYLPGQGRAERVESEWFRAFGYDELVARDKANLDITWLQDPELENADNLPAPEVIAREIVEDLESALSEFAAIADALENKDGDASDSETGASEPSGQLPLDEDT